ncbi:hypothetical protein TNCV_4143901 [Trichonephila clavipes]|nr:hypothetical protein TNCV_4143901 [Trichonephila clavipes]
MKDGCEKSLDNARSIVFSQRPSSTRLIEDETFNDNDIINNLTDFEDVQAEPDFLRSDKKYMQGSSLPTNRRETFSYQDFIRYQFRKEFEITKRALIKFIWLS